MVEDPFFHYGFLGSSKKADIKRLEQIASATCSFYTHQEENSVR
jgi:hypothetical protein